mgnify:FL=1
MFKEKYYELDDELETLVFSKTNRPLEYKLFYRSEIFLATKSKKYKDSLKAYLDEDRYFYLPKIISYEVII